MTDYTDLKRLSEAFPADLDWDSNTEPFFNGPSGESLGGGATGFYSVYGKPFRLEGEDYDYDGPTYVEACPADFAKFMVAAREGVLALIAENERLREGDQESTELCDTLSALLGQIAVAVRGPEEPKSRHGFHDLPSRVKTVVTERDQLKAEVDSLTREADRQYTTIEAYRLNAERYQWLREADWWRSPICVIRNPKEQAKLGSDCPSGERLDEAVDAAMGNGEQS